MKKDNRSYSYEIKLIGQAFAEAVAKRFDAELKRTQNESKERSRKCLSSLISNGM